MQILFLLISLLGNVITILPLFGLVTGDGTFTALLFPLRRSGPLLLLGAPLIATPFLGLVVEPRALGCFVNVPCDSLDALPSAPTLRVRVLVRVPDGSADRTIFIGDSDLDRREDDAGWSADRACRLEVIGEEEKVDGEEEEAVVVERDFLSFRAVAAAAAGAASECTCFADVRPCLGRVGDSADRAVNRFIGLAGECVLLRGGCLLKFFVEVVVAVVLKTCRSRCSYGDCCCNASLCTEERADGGVDDALFTSFPAVATVVGSAFGFVWEPSTFLSTPVAVVVLLLPSLNGAASSPSRGMLPDLTRKPGSRSSAVFAPVSVCIAK